MKSFLIGFAVVILAGLVGVFLTQIVLQNLYASDRISMGLMGAMDLFLLIPVTIVFAGVAIAGAPPRGLAIAAIVLAIIGTLIISLIVRASPLAFDQIGRFLGHAALIVLPVFGEWGVLRLYRLLKDRAAMPPPASGVHP